MTSRAESRRFDGMRIRDVANTIGMTVRETRHWLHQQGLRCRDNIVLRPKHLHEIQDEYHARIAAAPPSGPCFRCGAARHCAHR